MRPITPFSGGRGRGPGVLITAAIGIALPQAGAVASPSPGPGDGVGRLGPILTWAVQRADGGPGDGERRGPDDLSTAAREEGTFDEDEVTVAGLADLIGRTPAAGPVGRIAIACLDDDARAVRWATATTEALAHEGVGVLLADLTPGGTGWRGLSEVARGDARLSEVLDRHPYLQVASVGPGADRDRALGGVTEALHDVPSELAVVLVVLRGRDLRRRRSPQALRSGWFDRLLLFTATSTRSRELPRAGRTPLEVVVTAAAPPAHGGAAGHQIRSAAAPHARHGRTSPDDPTTSDAPSSPDEPYRSTTVRVLPSPERTERATTSTGSDREEEGAPPERSRSGERERYSPRVPSVEQPVTDRDETWTGGADDEAEARVAPDTAVAIGPVAENEEAARQTQRTKQQPIQPEARAPDPVAAPELAPTAEATNAEPAAPPEPETCDGSTPAAPAQHEAETPGGVRPEDIWTRPDEAQGQDDPRPHAKPLVADPELASRIWRDDEGDEGTARERNGSA
jgi:hypothetical protein